MTPARERLIRAELAMLRMNEIVDEARAAAREGNDDRIDALVAESKIILASMREIRREQLVEDAQRVSRTPIRSNTPRWRFW